MTFPIETLVHEHLVHNHYPPYSAGLVPFALDAIDKARQEEWDSPVTSEGGTLLNNSKPVTVREVIHKMHLNDFITMLDEQEEDDAEDRE